MDRFLIKTAQRLAVACLLLMLIVGPISWYMQRENTEATIVALATEESQKLIASQGALNFNDVNSVNRLETTLKQLVVGTFDIAEVYSSDGSKVAEALSDLGGKIEKSLPKHEVPHYSSTFYENYHLKDGSWVMSVFVPLKSVNSEVIDAYFEGKRVVPMWQQDQINQNAYMAVLIAVSSTLLTGLLIYPIVVYLSKENRRQTYEILDSHMSLMESLGRAIAKRDSDTGVHNFRVAWIAARIGEDLGIPGNEMRSLIIGSFLHDVGKIGIPDAILLKPGKLTDTEFSEMKKHVDLGMEIVDGIHWFNEAKQVVFGHHEKWNGDGYPQGVKGDDIPLLARIFAVADVYDALSSKRPYKESMPFDKVMSILRADTGSHFDPKVMSVFEAKANEICHTLTNASEEEVKALLSKEVQRYFGV
jgi:HD-GYP domain-containing protein (c-di-GMP phosphodiesterase class II)